MELEKALAKEKYSRMSAPQEDQEVRDAEADMRTKEEELEDARVERQAQLNEVRSRQVYQKVGKVKDMDFGRLRATDMKQNKRIYLPKAMNQGLEARMELRRVEVSELFDECYKLLTDGRGVTDDNLSESERRGLPSLQARVNER